MYDHIIVPFDGTEASRRASLMGADLSKLFEAHLVVVTGTTFDDGPLLDVVKARAISMSDELVDIWVEPGRSPERAVSSVVEWRPRSLVCMATHARGPLGVAVWGSVAEAVIRRIDVPVLLLGPRNTGADPVDLRRLVVCVDGSSTADAGIPLAAAWAQQLGLGCTLLNISGHGPDPDLDLLARVLSSVVPDVETLHVSGPDVAEGVVEVLEGTTSSMAVMATHARDGLARYGHRSVMMDVVRRSPAPVLVARADSIR